MVMRIIIAGGRDFSDYELLEKTLDDFIAPLAPYYDITIISGGAGGADRLGEQYAKRRFLECLVFEPMWPLYGRGAALRRNQDMAMYAAGYDCDRGALIAFWNGKSRGTAHMIECAKKVHLETHIVSYVSASAEGKEILET